MDDAGPGAGSGRRINGQVWTYDPRSIEIMQTNTHLDDFLARLSDAQATLDAGFARLPPSPPPPAIANEPPTRLHDNDPYFPPLYAGQMLKPPHPIARAAYALAMSINPNNHALDGGRASSAMEFEAVAALARMFGWPQH